MKEIWSGFEIWKAPDGLKMTQSDFFSLARAYTLSATVSSAEPSHSGVIDRRDQDRLQKLTGLILGPDNLRSPNRPVRGDDGIFRGGTALERSSRADGVKGARCYTVAYSYQDAPNIASATLGSKNTGNIDASLGIRKEINLVLGPQPDRSHVLTFDKTVPTIAAKHCMKTAPVDFCETLDTYGSLLNTPSIGESLQHLFTNVQVNISPAAAGCKCLSSRMVCGQGTHARHSQHVRGFPRPVCNSPYRQA